jgi:hypothetical protein
LVFGNAFSVRCSIGRFLLEDFAPVCCLVGPDALENPIPIRGVIGRSRLGDSTFLFHAVKRLAALPCENAMNARQRTRAKHYPASHGRD